MEFLKTSLEQYSDGLSFHSLFRPELAIEFTLQNDFKVSLMNLIKRYIQTVFCENTT